MTEINLEKALEIDLQNLPAEKKEYYYDLLNNERKKRDLKPGETIPVVTREDLYQKVKNMDIEEIKRELEVKEKSSLSGDTVKMERDWLRAHNKKGRPPIGGAQDD